MEVQCVNLHIGNGEHHSVLSLNKVRFIQTGYLRPLFRAFWIYPTESVMTLLTNSKNHGKAGLHTVLKARETKDGPLVTLTLTVLEIKRHE
jgi:hypothetical protein